MAPISTSNASLNASSNLEVQDLITRLERASENVKDLTRHEAQKLLAATRNLTAQLEGPETAIWKILFGVKLSSLILYAFRCHDCIKELTVYPEAINTVY